MVTRRTVAVGILGLVATVAGGLATRQLRGIAAAPAGPTAPIPVTPEVPALAPAGQELADTPVAASTAGASFATQTHQPSQPATILAATPAPLIPSATLADPLAVQAGDLTLSVQARPWGLGASLAQAPVLRTLSGTNGAAPFGAMSYQRAGGSAWYHLADVQEVHSIPAGIRIRVATDEPTPDLATIEIVAHGPETIHVSFQPPSGGAVAATAVAFQSGSDEVLLGLGEHFNGVELAGRQVVLWAADRRAAGYGDATYLPVPWLLSNRGYGFLLDDSRKSTWDVRHARDDAWSVQVEGPALAFYIIGGPPAHVIDRYTALSGRPPAPVPWALGVVKTLVGGEQRVLADAQRLQRSGIPVDGIFIFDATDDVANIGWPSLTYDPIPPGPYGDLRRLTDGIHRLGYHPLAYFGPDFRPARSSYAVAEKLGFLVRGADGQTWVHPSFGISMLDAMNPAAVQWWQSGPLKRAVVDLGFDGGMLDLGEAVPLDAQFLGGQSGAEVHNQYPVALASAMDGGLRALRTDATFWARSGYTGAQHFHRGTWSGDPVHSWEPVVGFPSVVPAGLSAGLAGYAYWHTEVSGYVDAGLPPSSERELYLRWLELGAFTSMLRDTYGDRRGKPTDIWSDAETTRLWQRYARAHRALGPYLLRAAQEAQATGLPLVRHLAIHYPADTRAWRIADQFLLGRDLLVAPVLEFGARERKVYLPSGAWRHWWSGITYEGPKDVTVAAPIDEIPVFVRGGVTSPLPDPVSV